MVHSIFPKNNSGWSFGPNMFGSRTDILDERTEQHLDVTGLKSDEWMPLSDNIRVYCILDYSQDAIVLIDMGGTETTIDILHCRLETGLTFEAPHHSLLTAIRYEFCDDLLIRSVPKTPLTIRRGRNSVSPGCPAETVP